MKVYEGSGVASTGTLKINKGIHALIIACSKGFDNFTNENITLQVEVPNGNNHDIAIKLPLIDFITECTFGSETVQSDEVYATIALCEICDGEGAYLLQDGCNILVSLDGLTAADKWKIEGVEDPLTSMHLKKLDRKTVASEDFSKTISTAGFDMAIINDVDETITEYAFTYSNGSRVKYSPFALRCLMRDADPIAYIKPTGSIVQFLRRLVIPLINYETGLSIESIEVTKEQGSPVNFVLSNTNFAA